MEHVVFFPGADGAPSFRRVSGLDEAVRLVEHLRNVEGIDHVTCHALTDVPLAFRPYYRVEVGGVEVGGVEVGAADPVVDRAPDPSYDEQPVPMVEQPAEEQHAELLVATAQSNGSRPRGANSLGFFA